MTISLQHYLILSVLLFAIGAMGVIARKNLLVMLMSIELMISAAGLAVLSFARWNLLPQGKAIVLFMIAVAAAEAAVGLSLIVTIYKRKGSPASYDAGGSVLVDGINLLRG